MPAIEHEFGDWTANNDGKTHTRVCRCGETETLAHSWSAWTEQTEGSYNRTCADCGASETMTLNEDKPVNTTDNNNAANTNLTNTDMELIEKVLTSEEQSQVAAGEEVKVYLKVEDITNNTPAEHKAEAEAKAAGDEIGMYLDIELFKKVGNAAEAPVATTAGAVTVTITIPDNLINNDASVTRTYRIVRVHQNEDGSLITDIIEGVFNPADNTFTFQTDMFSTYALAYADKPNVMAGDFNNDESVTDADAIYLLRHTLFPGVYEVNQSADVNDDGTVNDADAIYLLRHTLFPAVYPLHPGKK
jgi:hypothetical protein